MRCRRNHLSIRLDQFGGQGVDPGVCLGVFLGPCGQTGIEKDHRLLYVGGGFGILVDRVGVIVDQLVGLLECRCCVASQGRQQLVEFGTVRGVTALAVTIM